MVARIVPGMGSTKVSGEKLQRTLDKVAPCTIPQQAFGPDPIVWFDPPRPVWVWVPWRDRPSTREPGVARGANDRVVSVGIDVDGDHWEPVVWRNAVTVRNT